MDYNNDKRFRDIEEGISIISFIEDTIIKLNNISSKDFLFLNNLQKKYYSNVRFISENLSKIEIKLSNLEFQESVSNYISLISKILEEITNTKAEFTELLSQINDLSLNRSFLEISTYSFKQSIVALKLIGTSNRIDMISEKSREVLEINNLWGKVDDAILNIESDCKGLKSDLKLFNGNLEKLKEYVENEILNFENIINSQNVALQILGRWFNHDTKFVLETNKIKNNIEINFKNFNNIIINLQYHDIISQKMEHIQALLKEVKLELNNYTPNNNPKGENEINYLSLISEISKIQITQLLNINNEFQSATMNIVQKLFDISQKVTKTRNPMLQLQMSILLKEILETINESKKLFKDQDSNNIKFYNLNNLLIDINDSYDAIEKKYLSISNNQKYLLVNILAIEEKLEQKSLWETDYTEITNIIEQEASKLKITLFEINTIKSGIKKSINNLSKFENINSNLTGSKNVRSTIKSSSVVLLYNVFNSIDIKLKSSIELISQFEANVDFKINNISYFEYFDKNIKEIITGFNQIVEILNVDERFKKEINKADLEILRNKYTVESEHKVHNDIIGIETKENTDNNEEDDGIELF